MIAGFYDTEAEEVVAGCAVATRYGADLAVWWLDEDDFANPAMWWLIDAALAHRDLVDLEERIDACADTAGQSPVTVADLVRRRPVMWDSAGTYANRVAEAARRRRQVHKLLDEVAALGCDVNLVRPLERAA